MLKNIRKVETRRRVIWKKRDASNGEKEEDQTVYEEE